MAAPMGFSLATFNVRDFFDATPPGVIAGLDRAGTMGPAEQALARDLYVAKVATLAAAVRRLDADVVGFQEVKHAGVLDDLRAALPARDGVAAGGYGPAVAAAPDARGIACGLLSRFPVVASRSHASDAVGYPVFVVGDPAPFAGRLRTQRGVLEARVALPDGTALVLFVVHFKSPLPTPRVLPDGTAAPVADHRALAEGAVRSLVSRTAEALFARDLVDQRFDAEGGAVQLAVVGDFNDSPDSVTVRAVAGDLAAALDASPVAAGLAGRALYHCARAVPEPARFSLIHRGENAQPDHVLVSAALWSRFRGARFDNETLREQAAADAVLGACALHSDHAPLRAEFV